MSKNVEQNAKDQPVGAIDFAMSETADANSAASFCSPNRVTAARCCRPSVQDD